MKCFKHGGPFPCRQCALEEYDRCLKQNKEGKDPPNDLKELERFLGI